MEGFWIFIILLVLAVIGIVYGLISWPSNGNRKGKPTVLVVDDDEALRELLVRGLGEDYDIVEAEDGYAALCEVMEGRQSFDLIVTDLKMPRLDGMALLRKLPREIPVIVVSGYLDAPEFRDVPGDLRPVAVFERPFQISELRKAVRQGLGL